VATAIAVDGAGNVYVTGYSIDDGYYRNYCYATVKYDPSGTQLWVARYGDDSGYSEQARDLALDSSGNAYVTGDGPNRFATIRYSPDGSQAWIQYYGNTSGGLVSGAEAIAVDDDGNVYVTGHSQASGTESDYATVKYSQSGTQLWVARYNGPGNQNDLPSSIAVDDYGNVYVTGRSVSSSFEYNIVTVKYDSAGAQLWASTYSGPVGGNDMGNDIDVDGDGNVYVTGSTYTSGADTDYVTIKYGPDGDLLWVDLYYGYAGTGPDAADALALDGAGNIYVTGGSAGQGTGTDFATIRYSPGSSIDWVARYSGPPPYTSDYASDLAMDGSGNVYVTGHQGTSGGGVYCTIKYDPAGTQQWMALYQGPAYGGSDPDAIAVDGAGCVYVTGESTGTGTHEDYATVKYTQNTGIEDEEDAPLLGLLVVPDPAVAWISIVLTIPAPAETVVDAYGLDGRLVATIYGGMLQAGETTLQWQADGLPSGIYLLRVTSGASQACSRLVLLR
jgi:hypothetical protein